MPFRMLWTMIGQNFKTQRHVMIPFILALSMIFGIEFILLSLNMNEYVHKRSETLPAFIGIGNFFMSVLGFIFILYANRFMMKRRQQELAMYMVLGMEKKHFQLIMLAEMIYQYIVVALLSISGGYLFGALIFMLLNKLMHQTGMSLIDYPFNMKAMLFTLLMLAVLMGFLFIMNNIKLLFQSPIKLIRQHQITERRLPKAILYIVLVIGVIAIAISYKIALSDALLAQSLIQLFNAVFLVMLGTYCLFISLGVLLLEWLQKIPKLYYHPKYFFIISGLRSRINTNVIGLASISILCTFLIVTLGMTITTYRDIDKRIYKLMPDQYKMSVQGNVTTDKDVQRKVHNLEHDIEKNAKIDFFKELPVAMIASSYRSPHTFDKETSNSARFQLNNPYLLLMTQNDYNKVAKHKVNLNKDEVGLASSSHIFKKLNTINLMKTQFKAKQIDNLSYSYQMPEGLMVITPNGKRYHQIANYYMNGLYSSSRQLSTYETTFINFNIMTKDVSHFNKIKGHLEDKYKVNIDTREKTMSILYEFNGGLIFIGTVVSIVLLLGTFLMMYYKNIAEGYEDRRNYQIMAKVGIEDERIKSTINHQIIWIFALPILVAMIHVAVAFKYIFNLLGILSITDMGVFATSYIGVIVMVIAIYALMYWITSRIYYLIVHHYF
ncbi:ABC transporter permease [Staphylococcus croceilyticus]|uniref:ABC transporter permease n=1 Tax=Staphylococcus croceilyticus TaxID=319942 RepID=A0ABY2KGI5_9STAP|nr:FtsX-like permease family protein [Staphylococcus croceilyticus]PNZ70023.1 ABC transporter permease [Staphylococcus croceilyticus]TGA80441.1 ABC transporter permease [Staphylococcus croceilyticus]